MKNCATWNVTEMVRVLGYRLQASPFVSDLQSVRRTWRERLFTRPWRPRERFRVVHSPRVYVAGNVIWCSLETAQKVLDGSFNLGPKLPLTPTEEKKR